jgi:4-carboxymuconolactone decarboxylase
MTPQNPFEAMFRQTQEMAQEWVKAVNPAMAQFNMAAMDKMWPTVPKGPRCWRTSGPSARAFNPDGLDAKTRLLLTLQGLTMQGAQADTQIRLTVRHALEAGATKRRWPRPSAWMSMFAGMPAMNKAMECWRSLRGPSRARRTEMTVADFTFYLFAISVVVGGLLP